jgi:hypothetical protein
LRAAIRNSDWRLSLVWAVKLLMSIDFAVGAELSGILRVLAVEARPVQKILAYLYVEDLDF